MFFSGAMECLQNRRGKPTRFCKFAKSDVQRCPKMSKDVQRCPKMSKDVQRCPKMSKDVQRCPKYIYCAKDLVNLGVMKSVLWISVIMSHHYVILRPNRRTIRIQWESPQCPITRAQCGAVSVLLVLLGDGPLRATEIRGRSDSDKKLPQSQWKPHN